MTQKYGEEQAQHMITNNASDRSLIPSEVVSLCLSASAIAIVGASDDGTKASGRTQRYLRKYGFTGDIFPVNPNRDTVQGLPAYGSVDELPRVPDLAVIVLPAAAVEAAVRDCGAAGIKFAVVFASGYAEVGGEGAAQQDRLAATAAAAGVRLLGPNSVGAVFASNALTAAFMTGLDQDRFALADHQIAFVSQSGAMGGFILNMAQSAGLGIGRFFSTGNEADLGLPELIEGLVLEGSTRCVLAYVEGVRDGNALQRALAAARLAKVPVGLMKVGRSERGAAAAASHTGALAGSDEVLDGVLARFGAQRADDVEHLLDIGAVFAPGKRASGKRVSIVTLSGGAGVLMTDAAEDYGLEVPAWEGEWRDRMAGILPPFASVMNPIDTTGAIAADPSLLTRALQVCVEHPETDVAVILLGNLEASEDVLCAEIIDVAERTEKPVVVAWVGGSGRPQRVLGAAGIPTFPDPVRAMRAVAALVDWSEAEARHEPSAPERVRLSPEMLDRLDRAHAAGKRILDESESKELLSLCGMPTTREVVARSAAEAVSAAERLGFPVVLKLLSDAVEHKSDIGGVRLGLGSPQDVTAAASEVLAIAESLQLEDPAVVVQESASGSTELILGMSTDPSFGPVIVVGMGGIFAEIFSDARTRPAPVTESEAEQMLESLKGTPLLKGARGRAHADIGELAKLIARFSELSVALAGRVASIDVNPLLIDDSGSPVALDAVVTLRAEFDTGELA